MSGSVIEIQGTLRADGTLLLDENPNLPPGRVNIRIQSLPVAPMSPVESLVEYVLRSREELQAGGAKFMNDQEVTAWVEELRADDERIEQAHRQAREERRGLE